MDRFFNEMGQTGIARFFYCGTRFGTASIKKNPAYTAVDGDDIATVSSVTIHKYYLNFNGP